MGKSRPSLAVAAAAVLAAFALAACGGADGGSEDEDQISAAIERAATSGDPAACTEVQTLRFTEQTSGEGETGQAAIQQCEQNTENTGGDSVEVSDIEIDGNKATAKAAVTGRAFDGQTLDLALVKEGDQWKLNEFRGLADLNREALIASFKEQLSSEGDLPAQAADCLAQQLEKASDHQLESFVTSADDQAAEQIFGPCERFFQGQ
jgi:predicted small secreted protein